MSAQRTIYLGAGCFWGAQALMARIPGVLETCVGYANGTGEDDAVYETVCAGATGFRETVRVRFDDASVDALLTAFFRAIDPTAVNRQGNDRGTQYQAGIWWEPGDDRTQADVERICELARAAYPGFAVEVGPLSNFFAAEEYHQDYLVKNPGGYCHISPALISGAAGIDVAEGEFVAP